MVKELSYNYEFLNSIFTEKDFEFLNTYESDIKELETNINNQKMKRDEISNFITTVDNEISKTSNYDKYSNILQKTNIVLDCANDNIQKLYSLQNELISLDKEMVDFILNCKSSNLDSSNIQEINNIKNKISLCSESFSKIQNQVFLNDIKIDSFIKQIKTLDTFDFANTNYDIDENSQSSTDPVNAIPENIAIDSIEEIKDNNILLVSEKTKTVFLPYTKEEVAQYYKQYSRDFDSYKDVVRKQFVLPIESFNKHPALARFREGYSLMRDKEVKSIFDALKRGVDLMFKDNLYPAVICACKSEDVLNNYIDCLDNKKLDDFNSFEIKFEINPLKK